MESYTNYNALVVVVGVILALLKPDAVLALCMFAWAALASTTLVPYIYGLYWKKGTAKAAMITGAICLALAVFWKVGVRGLSGIMDPFMPDSFRNWGFTIGSMSITMAGTHEFIVSQVVAVIIFPIISLITKKSQDFEKVNELFKQMKELRE
ncbi:MAG: hypothetical protein ACTSRZ_05045 [Promethearchaeota archaeon]